MPGIGSSPTPAATSGSASVHLGPLRVRIAQLSLEGLDRLEAVELIAFVAADHRPLRGVAGLADWRMCGALSRQLKAGVFTSAPGEALLTIPRGQLPIRRLFLFGLDATDQRRQMEAALATVARAGGEDVALCPQGWDDGKAAALDAREVMQAARAAGLRRLWLLTSNLRAGEHALEAACKALEWASLEA